MHCLCCSRKLLRHINRDGLYGYCTHCRQVMPILTEDLSGSVLSSVDERGLGDRPCSPKGDRPCSPKGDRLSSSKTYWLYIPIQPEQRKTA